MPTQRQITVRRAPKYVPFLVAGGVLGVLIAAITSFSVPAPKDYTQGSVFGYFMILFAAGGLLLGGVVALVLDRISLRRSQRATVEEVDGPAEIDEPAEVPAAADPHDGDHSPSSETGTEAEAQATGTAQEGNGADPAPAP
ncbi:hypothetical protein RBS60_01875 [Sinomonas sp. ASV486]|uniref:hypothetical protein n=1 Tax=Sinomonas sp. ASV486 TaxID=3051170 RepID=UPI0027DB61A3|nr:hypothetical protein [Sinomonas sp. ASV486]MDQ4488942.1 hypothetical protein [Sinomonas sp. ASV486]